MWREFPAASSTRGTEEPARSGKNVLVPEKNITLNEWTGTGYIVTDGTNGASFIITKGTNGGNSTIEITADLTCVVLSSAYLIEESVKLMMIGAGFLTTGNVIVGVIVIALAAKLMYDAMDMYFTSVSLYLDAASGSETSEQSAENLKTNAKIGVVTSIGCLVAGPVLEKAGAVAATSGEKITQTRFGNLVGQALKKAGKPVADTIYEWGSGVNSAVRRTNIYQRLIAQPIEEDLAAELVIREYTDDVLEKICINKDSEKLVSILKDAPDEYIEYINKSAHPEYSLEIVKEFGEDGYKASIKCSDEILETISKSENKAEIVKFISKYTDDGAELFAKYGEDAVAAVNGCDAPYKAIQIIKNGGLQYGNEAVQAIKKSGDKAIEAVTKVPTKECTEVIIKYGDDAADLIVKYQEDAVKAMSKYEIIPENIYKLENQGITPQIYDRTDAEITNTKGLRNITSNTEAEKLISMNEKIHSRFTEQEINDIKAIALKFEDEYKKCESVNKKNLSPAVSVAYYKDETNSIYRYYISINSEPKEKGMQIVVNNLEEELQTKVNDIASGIAGKKHDGSIYVGTYGAGSHAEVKSVNTLIKNIKNEKDIIYNPDNVLVYVNGTHNISSSATEIAFLRCPHCSYILDDYMILSDCEIAKSGSTIPAIFMDELNQENIKIAIKSDSHKEALENLTINKDILKVLTSDQDFDTAIIVSCEK